MVFLGYTTCTCHTLVLLRGPGKWSNDNKDTIRPKRKGRRENERMMKFNSHGTWFPGHTLFVMSSTYTLDTPWAFKKVLEGGRDVGSNLRGRDPNTPDGREEPAEFWSSGYAGEQAGMVAWCPLASLSCLWVEGQEMENNSCPHNGHAGEPQEAWAIRFSPRLIVPITRGNFIPLKITMNFGLRRNGIICHLNVVCNGENMERVWNLFNNS